MAGQSAVTPVHDLTGEPFIAADIGGTHARVGLVQGRPGSVKVSVLAYHEYRCAEYAGLDAILRDFLDRHAQEPVRIGALACAGHVMDGVVINENLQWPVHVDALCRALNFVDLSVINDFEALAYATSYLDPTAATPLTHPFHSTLGGTRVLVGPGTGLGSAVLFAGDHGPAVLATEVGQTTLAPGNTLEADILRVLLARTRGRVSYEHVLSGPGLIHLYQAVCTLDDTSPVLITPEAITAAAQAGQDVLAKHTLDVFCGLLGSLAGDLAMLYGATGGVWLVGNILSHIRDFLMRSSFVERFLDKSRMRAFLERVPVRLMEHGQLGVIGAAGWYLEQNRSINTCTSDAAASGKEDAAYSADHSS